MKPPPGGGFPDPSSSGNSNRDSRILVTALGSTVAGPMMGHGGNGNDCLNPTLLGKYVEREGSAQAVNPLSRWPLVAGDSCGVGGAGDSGMQQDGFGGPDEQVIMGGSGNGSGSGSGGVATQRTLALLGEGAQSLPSLKDSGLLDSWGSSRATVSVDTQKQASNGSSQQQQQQQSLPRTTTVGTSINIALPSTSQHYTQVHLEDVVDLRPTTIGMPVGMSWLANESR